MYASTLRIAKHEPFAFNFFKPLNCAFAVRLMAEVMAMVKLRQIQRQMLFADMVKCSNDTTLKQREKPFNAIRRNKPVIFSAGIFPHCMFYGMMSIVLPDDPIAGMFVRMNFSVRFDVFINDRL